eukprot:CAMPEP_0174977126 /NCGR_PEP_ID=MMETSP0004_2-20121128/13433_1 /TAXON_ID=420556 /ORGANISM="Ochromonas sp., Strain CCMP1393" /LENGTH=48 /DNA_ID= /DNA_START= /DNA_END= /DNA_ORIENTATION=
MRLFVRVLHSITQKQDRVARGSKIRPPEPRSGLLRGRAPSRRRGKIRS